jgi:hypothetical protein
MITIFLYLTSFHNIGNYRMGSPNKRSSCFKSFVWAVIGAIFLIVGIALIYGASMAEGDVEYIIGSWIGFIGVIFIVIMIYCFYKAYISYRTVIRLQFGK